MRKKKANDLEAKVQENKNRIITLLKSTERPGIDGLIGWLQESDYFTAPASTRLDYHGCHEGGLAQHSLNVYEVFEEKAKTYGLDLRKDEIIIASLLHDACKIDVYQPNTLKSGNLSESKPYVMKDDFPMGHGEKSAFLVRRYIQMTMNETLLIRWHMGNFDGEWENYRERVENACPAIYAFQHSDDEASKYMDHKARRQ
ncbi:TPA: HD domain-containing protein [Candidatus Woesearchaeota archaeon]|nr:HD domain-containing protein [Candidatus Woesearchaeota archaeon]